MPDLEQDINECMREYPMSGTWNGARESEVLDNMVRACTRRQLPPERMAIVREYIFNALTSHAGVYAYLNTPGMRPLNRLANNAAQNIRRRIFGR